VPHEIAHRFGSAWRIALRLTALNIRAQLEYRGEFLLGVAIGAVWQISVIVFASVLLTRFPGMGGWASGEVLLIASMRLLSHGLQVLIFGRLTWMPMFMYGGLIDAYLLRPMPVYRQVQLAFFPPNAIGDLGVAVMLFAGAISRVDVAWTPGRIGYLVAAVIGGTLMEAAIFTTLASVSLHAPATLYWSVWLEDLLATFGNYPLSILPRLVGGVLTFLLPIAFIAYFPAAVITGHQNTVGVPAMLAAAAPLIGLVAFVASRRLFLVSLRHYKGMGSN
jgi:ABC-2 type transport system permease protein